MVPRETAGDDLIRLAWPDVGAEEAAAVAEVLASGRLTMGPKVAELEGLLAAPAGSSTPSRSRPERPRSIWPSSPSGSSRATR